MAHKDKELLLQDLSARLPYGVMLKHISIEKPFKLFSIKRDEYESYKKDGVELAVNGIYYDWYINDTYHDIELYIKPYLRPMSSMTEEERREYEGLIIHREHVNAQGQEWDIDCFSFGSVPRLISWLNAHHFDYHGLIPMGLAIEVTEDNNPYKE